MRTCNSTWFTKERQRMKDSFQQLSGIFIPVLNSLINFNVQTLWLNIWLPPTAFNDAFNERILMSAWCVSWSGSASLHISVSVDITQLQLLRAAVYLSKYSMWPTLAFAPCSWLLGTLRRALATDFAVCVNGREWRRPFLGVTPPLHFYTLQDLIQDITCRKQRMNVSSYRSWRPVNVDMHLPELGQRCLKSSLVSRHKARPFISKRPFSGRRSEYSFCAQWSQRATSSLSHNDGFIPAGHLRSHTEWLLTEVNGATFPRNRDSRSRPGRRHRSSRVGGLSIGSWLALNWCTLSGVFPCNMEEGLFVLLAGCESNKNTTDKWNLVTAE